MKHTLSQIKQSLLSKTGSRALTNITNFYSMVQEVCFSMMAEVDLPSAIRKVPMLATIQESPNLYVAPNDFSNGGLIGVYNRDYIHNYPINRVSTLGNEFMRKGLFSSYINLESIDGNQYINMADNWYNPMVSIDLGDDTGNGTWTATGTSTDVRYDTAHKISGNSSVAFNSPVTASPFGISKNNFRDVANGLNMNFITMQAYFPTYVTGVKVKYGTDSSNYHEIQLSRDWQGKRFTIGWNVLAFDIINRTTTGIVVNDDVTYFEFLIDDNISSLQTGYRINAVAFTMGYSYDLRYYSSSIVCNQYGERIDNCLPTADSDYILLNAREHALFVKQFAVISAIDTQVAGNSNQFNAYSKPLQEAYETFRMDFPSERIITSSPY